MKWKILILSVAFAVATIARAATNDLTGLLQKGLFEEEANRDLDAAISNYQMLAGRFDKDRQTAATAIFRLGECYRKLGKTNEATAQYQRILREFPEQQTLATLSQQNLTGLGASANPAKSPGVSEDMRMVQQQILGAQAQLAQSKTTLENLKAMNMGDIRKALPSVVPDAQFDALMQELNIAEQQLISLRNEYSQDHPKYKTCELQVKELNQKVNDRIEGILLGLQTKVEAETAYLDALKAKGQDYARNGSSSSGSGQGVMEQLQQQLASVNDRFLKDVAQLNVYLASYGPTNSLVIDLQKQIHGERATLDSLEAQIQKTEAPQSQDTATSVTDEEQKEIRRIQLMIQNSPDLINAGTPQAGTPLQGAAWSGQLVVARYLLDHGAEVDKRVAGESGLFSTATPLYLAAMNGHKAMVELLLARGANVNGSGSGSDSNPLFMAVSQGYEEVANVLIANKADVDFAGRFYSGNTPLSVAATKNETNLMQSLISHGAKIDVKNRDGQTPLFLAATANSMDAAKILMGSGAEVDARDKKNETPLHGAAFYGYAEMISFLIEHGASVDATNYSDATPLLIATGRNKTEVVRALLEHKADPNHAGTLYDWGAGGGDRRGKYLAKPVSFAIMLKSDDILRLLLDAGANPNNSASPNLTPLAEAINYNDAEGVRLLLDHGANPNLDKGAGTPLNQAVGLVRDPQIIKSLLDKGADPNVPNQSGYTPIMMTYDLDVIRWLIEHKADLNAKIKDGRTSLMLDRGNNAKPEDSEKYRILLDNGAKPDLQDAEGNTALHHAVEENQTNLVAALLQHKANPNIQNNDGLTPLDLAMQELKKLPPVLPPPTADRPSRFQLAQQIVVMLTEAGGLVNLPKRDRIEVRRGTTGLSYTVFTKDSNNRNYFSLLELIAVDYGLLFQTPSGPWQRSYNPLGGNTTLPTPPYIGLPFPDFKNIVIHRRSSEDAQPKAISVNVEDILNSGDCSRDVPLEWGDVIEIPEADHPVDQTWQGLADPVLNTLNNCLSRQVSVKIKGDTTVLKLAPDIADAHQRGLPHGEVVYGLADVENARYSWPSFMLLSVLDNSKLLRVSSDLAHVKVTRHDPITGKTEEWTVDGTSSDHGNLWLRDGDVVEVPEK